MKSKKHKPGKRPIGITLFALLIGLGSLLQLGRSSVEGGHPGLMLISFALLLAGLYTATELWRVSLKAVPAYIVWLSLVLIRIGTQESLSGDTSTLEIALGIGFVGIVWTAVLFYLRSALSRASATS